MLKVIKIDKGYRWWFKEIERSQALGLEELMLLKGQYNPMQSIDLTQSLSNYL